MNGADSLIQSLANAGITTCFANPGTSEMQLVAAIDKQPAMRAILCLYEGVASGAADGYARMEDKPAHYFILVPASPTLVQISTMRVEPTLQS